MSTQLLHGDCYEIISTLPDNSIDLIVTDPPFKFQTAGGSLYKKQASRAKTLAQLETLECCDFSCITFHFRKVIHLNNKVLYIQAVYEDGTELSMSSLNWFYSAKFKGHQFGKEMEMDENEKEF